MKSKISAIFPLLVLLPLSGKILSGQGLLIPMDLTQTDHLKAYGAVYQALLDNHKVEWLLNYRGGSFLLPPARSLEEMCRLRGVDCRPVSESQKMDIYVQVEAGNMERIELEKAPRLAVYVPPTYDPWDDAVRLALDYAQVPYSTVWDEEVLSNALGQYDWLHLHHEDFTGQFGKFYASFQNADWYKNEVRANNREAGKLGFGKVSQLKLAVAQKVRQYLQEGGFLFAMCSAPATLDIALAAHRTDIVPAEFDGDPADPRCQERLDYSQTIAFTGFRAITSPMVYEHSDIDVNNTFDVGAADAALEAPASRGPETYFTLFDFSAKYDPVSCMLTQNHAALVREFLGQDTGFRRTLVKDGIVLLAEVAGTDEVKYLHGLFGKGSFAYMGGHDPEDYQHLVGDPPTDLRLHRNSPGYRLILNNILFPAAKKKPLKT
ncbi:MAG TPA: asparagine synthetase B [candidate division Zixibacteria bacterium]|nr:asparagine synthetase B [candidate division Zixibacteria bacterium]